jgi:hypothetical protein
MTGGLLPISSSWRRAPWDSRLEFFSKMDTCGLSPYITSSLTRGWVYHLQLMQVLASAFILASESCGTSDHILISQIRDFPFCRLLRLAGLRWKYSTPPPHGKLHSTPGIWIKLVCTAAYIVSGLHAKCWLPVHIRGNFYWFHCHGKRVLIS